MDQRHFAKSLRQNMTDAERLLWKHLRAHRFSDQKIRRQQPIGPYIVDFVHFGARMIIECDGGQHNDNADDRQRDAWLNTKGFRVLRFWNHDILNQTECVLSTIFAALNPLSPNPSPARGEGDGGVSSHRQKTDQTNATLPPRDSDGLANSPLPSRDSNGLTNSPLPSRDSDGLASSPLPSWDSNGLTNPPLPLRDSDGLASSPLPSRDSNGLTNPPLPPRDSNGLTNPPLPPRDSNGLTNPLLPPRDNDGLTNSPLPSRERGRGRGGKKQANKINSE